MRRGMFMEEEIISNHLTREEWSQGATFEDLITFIKSSHREHTALIDERLESAFTRLNEKLDSISSFTRDLDLRVANIASSIKREEGATRKSGNQSKESSCSSYHS
ncbi:unnamed protein product [Microthlaspi erraticum]|uniref:Uncharacterized protein n=1 Tax=Microthlaspi erraticum TaxID=1685480 RepID=A0A6D2IU47_9BRAS|nr:unnamed protein product [Microthlaspi erraticum]